MTEKRCPSCGACKECGAPKQAQPPFIPYPVPVYPQPLWWQSSPQSTSPNAIWSTTTNFPPLTGGSETLSC